MPHERRTQADRRERTRATVLACATRLFGEQGYAETSLDQIAIESGTTIRPVYHYFGNKRALFEAVAIELEARLLRVLADDSFAGGREGVLDRFRACLRILAEPTFQRVALIDAPAVLGRERWSASPVSAAASALLATLPLDDDPIRSELLRRMMIGALTEAAIALSESRTRRELETRIDALIEIAARTLPR